MESKIFTLLTLSILMTVFLVSAVSADVIFSDNFEDGDLIDWTVTGWTNGGTFAESSGEVASLSQIIPTSGFDTIVVKYDRQLEGDWESSNSFNVSWSTDGINFNVLEEVIGNDAIFPDETEFMSKTFNIISVLAEDNSNFQIKFECDTDALAESCKLDNIIVEGTEIVEEPLTCAYDEGSLGIDIRDITVINGFGDDEEWLPFDEIEVEIEVENTNDDEKIKDIEIEWGLWSEETNEWIIELDDVDEFDLKKDSEETIIIKFKLNEKKLDVNLDELEEGDYTLYVIANGEEQEKTPDESVCSIGSEAVKIFIENDFVILGDIEVNGIELEDGYLLSDPVSCDSTLQITADVWNIGNDDQDDVYVMVHNNELGINEKVTIGDIDAFEDEKLTFEFEVPTNTEEKWYDLWFTVYDEDDDVYENDYDDEKSEFKVSFKVEGNCIVESQVMVTATLESGGKAGEELVIRATVTNTGNSLTTYTLNAEEYNEWATLTSVEPSAIILEAGKSKDVLITFNVNQDASGDKLFNIDVLSKDESVLKQPVSVTIEKASGFMSGITGNIISEGNWYLWGIGALNVLLVIIIILVAVKVSKKSE